jgi:hypothetical protein
MLIQYAMHNDQSGRTCQGDSDAPYRPHKVSEFERRHGAYYSNPDYP